MSSFHVSLGVWESDEEVIHIDDEPSFSNHVSKRAVHELMEHGRGVTKTKEYNSGFEDSFVGDEGHLPLVAIFDMDIVVPSADVKLGEVASVFQLVHEIGDERKGVGIVGGVFIEVVVVLAGVEFTIFLLDKEKRGCLRGIGRMDLSSS